ncbi:hypothetical protein RIF29_09557 [Crotalaria pallida]|uniref:Uncharacterized protein n=1 Tax=Crotalaria pallida TaxID=3830 RepID=A0AAN9FS12_CROPI
MQCFITLNIDIEIDCGLSIQLLIGQSSGICWIGSEGRPDGSNFPRASCRGTSCRRKGRLAELVKSLEDMD